MNLGILNTVIAMVIVLLVLSLIVQSLQTLVKKLLKLKSRQFKGSLIDLYNQAIERSPDTPSSRKWLTSLNTGITRVRFRRKLRRNEVEVYKSKAERFVEDVLNEFKNIGRVTFFDNPVLDSLSWEDLFKIVGKLDLPRLFPAYVHKFEQLRDAIVHLRDTVEKLANHPSLGGTVSPHVNALRSRLAPVFNDIQSLNAGGESKTLLVDLLHLKDFEVDPVFALLKDAQNAVDDEKQTAARGSNSANQIAGLEEVSLLLREASNSIGGLRQKFEDAVLPLRNKVEQLHLWFDTVTQSFDERYARHMRTISILLSFVLVILLNANFFRVYKSISTNEVQRDLIAESGPEVLALARKARVEPSPSSSPRSTATASPTPSQLSRATASGTPSSSGSPSPTASPTASATPSPSPSPSLDIKKEIDETRQNIAVLTGTYEGFGFAPLNWHQANYFLWSLAGWTPARNEKGVIVNKDNEEIDPDCHEVDKDEKQIRKPDACKLAWRRQNNEEWWASRRADLFTVFGWAIMAMLLSVGAPFWQDTLESLFGIKNLLRQKSGTQNVETESGKGQPRS